jgi:hypothetical protein
MDLHALTCPHPPTSMSSSSGAGAPVSSTSVMLSNRRSDLEVGREVEQVASQHDQGWQPQSPSLLF